MKYVQSIVFRALCALCVGALLIAFPDNTTEWLVRVVGLLFIIPGLVSIGAYYRMRSSDEALRPLFPILGVGCLLFGMLLIFFAPVLKNYIMYALSAFLVLLCIAQMTNFFKLKKYASVGTFFFVIPVLVIVAALMAYVNVDVIKEKVLTILGGACLAYGLMELLSAIHFRKARRLMMSKENGEGEASAVEKNKDPEEETTEEEDQQPEQPALPSVSGETDHSGEEAEPVSDNGNSNGNRIFFGDGES